MNKNKRLLQIFLAVVLVNAAGLALRLIKLDSYIILAGFRFHISLVLPFLLFLKSLNPPNLKQALLHPPYNKTFQPLGWIFFPLILLFIILYILKKIEIGDPEYFYEFGLSSIVDYPVYLIWNLPQLLMFACFIIVVQPSLKLQSPVTALIIFLLFAFEFIPLGKAKIDYLDLISLLFASLSIGLLVRYFQNIYWLAIIIFTIFWVNLLAFGSDSPLMIHILFAARYESWEGFFDIPKNLHSYLLPFQLLATAIIIYFSSLKRSRNV